MPECYQETERPRIFVVLPLSGRSPAGWCTQVSKFTPAHDFQVIKYDFSYFEIIKQPMDLTTLNSRLPHLPNREAFEADVRLIISNAKTYNAPGSPVYQKTVEFENFFNKGWCHSSLV